MIPLGRVLVVCNKECVAPVNNIANKGDGRTNVTKPWSLPPKPVMAKITIVTALSMPTCNDDVPPLAEKASNNV